MEHGLAWPRHRVVGSAWQHAHEWVRHNLQFIVDTVKEHDAGLDLIMTMNLPRKCFATEEIPQVGAAGWSEEFTGLGKARHAFPKTTYRTASFERDPKGRQHLTCMSDGGHSMWKHLREGLGHGNTAAWHIDACSFHLWQNLESMVNRDIKAAQAARKRNVTAWDQKHPGGKLLDEDEYKPSFQSIFGDWWLPRRVLCSTRGYCAGRYCSLQYRQYRKPFWVLHSTRSRYGYCAVPAVPTGTAVLQLVLWVLCSTRLITVLHSTAVLQAGTAQYIKRYGEPGIFLEIRTEWPRD